MMHDGWTLQVAWLEGQLEQLKVDVPEIALLDKGYLERPEPPKYVYG